jgi:hypothetical protein
MGREFRILAAAMSWPDLLAQLEDRVADLISPRSAGMTPGRPADVTCTQVTITAVEHDGKARLSGLPPHVSGGDDPDLVCEIAAASGRLVVGCGVDAEKGECHLVVADGDGLRRCYHHRRGEISRPFQWGEPIPTEDEFPLNGDNDLLGLQMALRYCGFQAGDSTDSEAVQTLCCQARPHSAMDGVNPGPLGRAIRGHYDWYGVPDEEPLSLVAPVGAGLVPDARRELQPTPARRRIKRFYTWINACRPPLLLRGVAGPASPPARGAARWTPGRELS